MMGRLLKFLLIAALLAGAAALAVQALRRRRPAWPAPEPGWSPPAVEPALTLDEDDELEREIADAEAEGMRAPDWEPPVDVAIDETGRVVEPEPPAEEAVLEPPAAEDGEAFTLSPEEEARPDEQAALAEAFAGDDAAAAEEALRGEEAAESLAAPAEIGEEAALDAEPEEQAALAGDDAAAAEEALRGLDDLEELSDEAVKQLFAEAEEFERAIAEFEQLEQAMAGTFGGPEPGAAAAEPPEAFAHPVEALEERAEAEADVILRRFEELAAQPEEPPAPSAAEQLERAVADAAAEGMAPPPDAPPVDLARDEAGRVVPPAPPEPPAQPAAPEEPLFASVEEALDELAPRPIQPPPRRSAESYLDEGNVYFNVGQFALAIDRYTQAILLDPELTAAYYNRANAYTRSGDYDRALADYNKALELLPNDADALNNRGMLFLYRGNSSAAIADFDAALAIDPGDTTVMVNRGLARLHGGDAAGALQDFLTAAGLDPRDPAAHYGAAQAAAVLGNREEALRHIERALALDAGYAREAAADPRLAILQGDPEFLRLLREAGKTP
ncbi:tetratricopeptide repeat protein [Tepidiforma flava]|uniref:Tetratricopeptide repeat protein n=1 Tax=Tepidiforma flava TaxID=3004094 RepID=A0ABY7MCY7_9CHLR|nr:tetratricopeptide repeat protein [Tepidiforma flava]WBL37316.1 tetratricopeptide repeat protein [Tepidiforma flava]